MQEQFGNFSFYSCVVLHGTSTASLALIRMLPSQVLSLELDRDFVLQRQE